MDNDFKLGVNCASGEPGVVPVAFVAFVQVLDAHGDLHVVRVESEGLTQERAERILQGEPE